MPPAQPPADLEPGLMLRADDDPLQRALAALVRVLVHHPVAAQAAFTALIAEGRRFGRTPEGQSWKTALAGSELVRRGRARWESSALNFLVDDVVRVIPAAIFDALVRALSGHAPLFDTGDDAILAPDDDADHS